MSSKQTKRQIFKAGSRTYYTSSLFFPKERRREVETLYAFVRSADDFVDAVPQDTEGFFRFRDAYLQAASSSGSSGDPIIDDFIALGRSRGFDPDWARAFLHSMELDLTKQVYATMDETLEYIYGSAEVIGLFMNRILEIPQEADRYARMLGRAMQYINFIRDIDEDVTLGRTYLPGVPKQLAPLSRQAAEVQPELFATFVRAQIEHYHFWQKEAEEGYPFLPLRYRIPIKSAADMYSWTASRIFADPHIVFRYKVKPGKLQIIRHAAGLWIGESMRERSRL